MENLAAPILLMVKFNQLSKSFFNNESDPHSTTDGGIKMRKRKLKKPSIETLQALLKQESEVPLQIMPNGEVYQGGRKTKSKPITLKEDLGGEYAIAA